MSGSLERGDQLAILRQNLDGLRAKRAYNQLEYYRPYAKQRAFHAAAGPKERRRERLLIAANQVGKTLCAGAEVAIHLTGMYPDWWEGIVFEKPTVWWCAGITGESTRDNPQRILMGRKREYGTGMIPYRLIKGAPTLARGVPDLLDSFAVHHTTGGTSYCWFKSYEKGREKAQGETLHGAWLDEEPPLPFYTEVLTRTNRYRGPIMLTFTPLLGMSEVVRRFLRPSDRVVSGGDVDEDLAREINRLDEESAADDKEMFELDG